MRSPDFARMRPLREVRAQGTEGDCACVRYYDECTGALYDVDRIQRRYRRVLDLGQALGEWEAIDPS